LLFPDVSPRTVQVDATAFAPGLSGEVKLDVPAGWRVEPASNHFELREVGQRAALEFKVTPGTTAGKLQVRATGSATGRTFSTSVSTLKYEHIPNRSIFPDANAAFVRTDVRTLARNVGYVMGAGDEVPRALEQLGCNVILLDQQALSRGDLSAFDAIVTGVRAYNVRDDLIANQHRLLEYVRNGGTMVVQYNVGAGGPGSGRPERFANIGPYPLRISRDRVTVEEAPVQFVDALPAVMARPNAITPADFEGWVQERGLYFPGEWDAKYSPLISTSDPGEKPLRGGILVARHGKGVYVYTSLSWFRQLPAGVPGAYRMFANLLSAGKVLQ
jgi:hypothetical protein